jgi:hypothetical protein
MFNLFISQFFLLIWLAIFYGILYVFHRFVPKGIIIAQILFIYIWILLPYYDVHYIGFVHYEKVPIFWIVASLIILFSLNKKA